VEADTLAHKSAVRITKENFVEYVSLNVLYYGSVAVSMIYVFFARCAKGFVE